MRPGSTTSFIDAFQSAKDLGSSAIFTVRCSSGCERHARESTQLLHGTHDGGERVVHVDLHHLVAFARSGVAHIDFHRDAFAGANARRGQARRANSNVV